MKNFETCPMKNEDYCYIYMKCYDFKRCPHCGITRDEEDNFSERDWD